jgi:hypothetical protein
MRIGRVSLLSLMLTSVPLVVTAQGTEDGADAAADAGGEEASAPRPTPAAPAAETTKQPIKRGLHAQADLGIFITFGGRNTNNIDLPSRGTSNLQPFLGLTLGYDVAHSEAYSFSLGLKLGAGYSAGAGRVSAADIANDPNPALNLTTRPNDFAVMEVGVAAAFGYMMSERLALTFKADGGLGIVDPHPTRAAGEDGAGGIGVGPAFGASLGAEYFPLLNDFSVGIDARFAGVLVDGLIPGLSVTVPIKYTF